MENTTYTNAAFFALLDKVADEKINPTLSGRPTDVNATCAYVKPADIEQQGENVANNCVAGRIFRIIGVTNQQLLPKEGEAVITVIGQLNLPFTQAQQYALKVAQNKADSGATHAEAVAAAKAAIGDID